MWGYWDGSAWRGFPSGTRQALNKVWGSGPNDVWAVGSSILTVASWVGRKGDECQNVDDWAGLARRRPAIALVMTLFMLSLAGFPPTGGFFAKFYLSRAAVERPELVWLVVAAVLSSARARARHRAGAVYDAGSVGGARDGAVQATLGGQLPTTCFCGGSGMRTGCDRLHLCPSGAGEDCALPGAAAAPSELRAVVD